MKFKVLTTVAMAFLATVINAQEFTYQVPKCAEPIADSEVVCFSTQEELSFEEFLSRFGFDNFAAFIEQNSLPSGTQITDLVIPRRYYVVVADWRGFTPGHPLCTQDDRPDEVICGRYAVDKSVGAHLETHRQTLQQFRELNPLFGDVSNTFVVPAWTYIRFL